MTPMIRNDSRPSRNEMSSAWSTMAPVYHEVDSENRFQLAPGTGREERVGGRRGESPGRCILPIMTTGKLFLATLLAGSLALSPLARADEAANHYNLGLQLKRAGKNADAIGEMEK